MFDPDSIPPVVRILLDEELPASRTPTQVKRFFRRLVPELEQQAIWSIGNFESVYKQSTEVDQFTVVASGSLNPLNKRAICNDLKCRIAAATSFARTLGLYADVVVLPDMLTTYFLADQRLTNAHLYRIASECVVLKVLEPLIRSGIVRFRWPFEVYCEKHHRELEERLTTACSQLLPQLIPEITFQHESNQLSINQGSLRNSPLISVYDLTPEIQKEMRDGRTLESIGRQYFERELVVSLYETISDMASARRTNGTLFSSSRLDLLSVRTLEKTAPEVSEIEPWEQSRSAELPWSNQLSPDQVVQLREEAGEALPRFREMILRTLTTGGDQNESAARAAIAELRAGAAELAAEFRALNASGETLFRNLMGVLGITVSVYGFASGLVSPALALTSLTSLLGLLHTSARKDEQDLAKLRSNPAYVLLKAKEIISHNH